MAKWDVRLVRAFEREVKRLDEETQVELLAHAEVLEHRGPSLGRPLVDTLRGSAYPNMKELRFNAGGGVWRVAFAFDPASKAVLLVAGDKFALWGRDEQAFYRRLIRTADDRFGDYLRRIGTPATKAAGRAVAPTEDAGSRPVSRQGKPHR